MDEAIRQRVQAIAAYMVRSRATVRQAAGVFGISKSSVHKDMGERLPLVDPVLGRQVAALLRYNKAVRHLRKRGCRRLMMLGITGRRDDHTLGNISLLVYYLQMGMKAVAVTDWGTFVPCRGNALLKTTKGQQVSLFNFRATGIKSNDLVYPPYDTTMLWQGTLNEAKSDHLSIQAEGDYLVYLVNMQQAPLTE